MFKSDLSELRKIIWPIEVLELKKFIPMAIIMFGVLFNYTIVRALKDSLIIPAVGAEAIGFIKLWAVLPSAVLFVIIYDELSAFFNDEKVFYIIILFFLGFFSLFAFYLYPQSAHFHPSVESINTLAATYPHFKWLIYIYGKWTYALFYIFAELWGSAMLSLLFWQFANKITTSDEAKRFYPMLGFFANIALILAGICLEFISKNAGSLPSIVTEAQRLESSQKLVSQSITMALLFGVVIIASFKWMHKNVLNDIRYYPGAKQKKQKAKLSVKESFRLIIHSKYLGYIALLVLCYGVSINLVEGPWKAKIREYCSTEYEYLEFMGSFIKWTGIGSLVAFFIGSNILRKTSWYNSAIITPILILITGSCFFIFSTFSNWLDDFLLLYFGASALAASVFFGMIQNILSKATKYSLFDSTKEMAYIPIDTELKTRGKAAVDVIGARLGKSGGALIQVLIFSIFHTTNFNTISPWLMFIFIAVISLWIYAVKNLNKEYLKFESQAQENL